MGSLSRTLICPQHLLTTNNGIDLWNHPLPLSRGILFGTADQRGQMLDQVLDLCQPALEHQARHSPTRLRGRLASGVCCLQFGLRWPPLRQGQQALAGAGRRDIPPGETRWAAPLPTAGLWHSSLLPRHRPRTRQLRSLCRGRSRFILQPFSALAQLLDLAFHLALPADGTQLPLGTVGHHLINS